MTYTFEKYNDIVCCGDKIPDAKGNNQPVYCHTDDLHPKPEDCKKKWLSDTDSRTKFTGCRNSGCSSSQGNEFCLTGVMGHGGGTYICKNHELFLDYSST